jgi:inorganic pyrophosphatase
MSDDELVRVRVEIPKGSRNKYEWDEETGAIELDRRLFAAVSYPTEYGFVMDTLAEDGDELDALVAVTEPTFPGCVIRVKPLALLRMYDGDTANHKLLGAPVSDPAWNRHDDASTLPGDLLDEIVHFFEVYTDLEGKDWQIEGWGDRDEALAVLEETRRRAGSSHRP